MKKTLSIISFTAIAAMALFFSGCDKQDEPVDTIVANYGIYCITGSYEDGTAYGRMYLYQNASSYNAVTGGMSGEFIRFEFTLPKGAGSIFGQEMKIVKTPNKKGTSDCFCYKMHEVVKGWISDGEIYIRTDAVSGRLKYEGKNYKFIFNGNIQQVEKANG